MYRVRHRVGVRALCFAIVIFTFQLTTYIYFLNPACPRRDGVKEDYYV